MVMSSFLNSSILGLCFLYIILFKLSIMFFTFGNIYLFSIKMSNTRYVSRFWDKFNVIMFPKQGNIFIILSSVNLLRINFTVFSFVPGINQHICSIILSPNSAFVKSNVYDESVYRFSNTFSYFYGTFIVFSFFLVGLTNLSVAIISYLLVFRFIFSRILSNFAFVY